MATLNLGKVVGNTGPAGPGVAPGGSSGQVLAKKTDSDYDTEWINPPSGSGGSVAVDATLTKSGQAADAKATGDAIAAEKKARVESVNQLSQHKADKAGWTPNKLIGTDAEGNLVAQDPPEDNGGDADTLGGKPASDYLLKTEGLQMKLLWENDSRYSDFDGREINVNGAGYDLYAVVASTHKSIPNEKAPVTIFPVGDRGMSIAFLGTQGTTSGTASLAKRTITGSTESGITFDDAYRANAGSSFGESNDCIIPLLIYGIKGVT